MGIVEDEPIARQLVEALLAKYFPKELAWLFEAGSVKTGRQLLGEHRPDILFLDIQIQGGESFELLDQVDTSHTKVIFITAFEEHSIRAIRAEATDYLLKPINHREFKEAVARALDKLRVRDLDRTNYLLKVPDKNGTKVLETGSISHLEADGAYTRIHHLEGEYMMSSQNLSKFEEKLLTKGFIRVHRSYLVNARHISSVKSSTILMQNQVEVPLSRRRSTEVEKALESMR